jgi:hypothetical protein
VAPARLRPLGDDVPGKQAGQELRGVDGAVGVVLGRAAVQLAAIQLVQVPLDAYGAGPDELGLQTDEFAPTHAGIALRDAGDELVVPAGEQGPAFGDQQDAERVGDDLLRSAVAEAPGPLAATTPPGSGIGLPRAVVDRVPQDEVQGAVDGRVLCGLTTPRSTTPCSATTTPC